MKRASTLFLKGVIILIGIGVLAGLIWLPQTEGRNVNADLVTIYLKDPFLAYVYVASTPFFMGLYQAFKLLGYIEQDKAFSQTAVKALRNIKYCAIAIIGFVIAGEAYIIFGVESDDRAGGVAMGVFTVFASTIIAAAASVFERLLQKAADTKPENDLTA